MASYTCDVDVALADIRKVLIDRMRKYGYGNIARHGELGLLVRLDDKLARLSNLLESGFGVDASDETKVDTVVDIAGYAVIWLLWLRGAMEPCSQSSGQSCGISKGIISARNPASVNISAHLGPSG